MITNHPKMALVVMVRDEEKTFPRLVESVRDIIDYWVVVDTGSVDNTVQAVRDSLAGIDGELHERQWVNFAHNRTETMVFAQGKADWLLIMDADQVVEGVSDFLDSLYSSDADAQMVEIRGFDMVYRQPKILRGDRIWEWTGVVHEYVQIEHGRAHKRASFDGFVVREMGDGGYRHSDRTKVQEQDKLLLEQEVKKNPGDARSWFYLGQTYSDMGLNKAALIAYKNRVLLGDWAEEQYYAQFQVGNLHAKLGDMDAAVGAWLRAWDMRPTRVEALVAAVRELRIEGRYKTAQLLAEQGLSVPVANDILFVRTEAHEYELPLEHSICVYYTQGPVACVSESEALLAKPGLPAWVRKFADENIRISKTTFALPTGPTPM